MPIPSTSARMAVFLKDRREELHAHDAAPNGPRRRWRAPPLGALGVGVTGPMISVIVPALNEEAGIAAALASARAPGVREIIVVDGGSGDATLERAREGTDLVLSAPRGRALQ